MPEHRVVVVGAGIGGLCAALRLAGQGLAVTLVDAAEGPGGKMRPLQVDGQPVDAGPTVFTMRWVLDELLDELGTSAAQALPPLQLYPLLSLPPGRGPGADCAALLRPSLGRGHRPRGTGAAYLPHAARSLQAKRAPSTPWNG